MAGWLERTAERFLEKHGDAITQNIRAMTAAMPAPRDERRERADHDAWAKSAQLGRPYWIDSAAYYFLDDAACSRVCYGEFVFTKRTATGLLTASGIYSWNVWARSGRLSLNGPMIPSDPAPFTVSGQLGDDPRKWELNYR